MSTESTFTRYSADGDVEEPTLDDETAHLFSIAIRGVEYPVVSSVDAEPSSFSPTVVAATDIPDNVAAIDPD